MAALIAAVIAGVPGRIINETLARVRASHPDILVIRGVGARSYVDGRARYAEDYVDAVVEQAADAVFGQSARPKGFCRNPQRECLGSGWSRVNCGKSEDQTCGRKKPDRFFLFYQEADEAEERAVVDKFRHAPAAIRIPRACYDNVAATATFVAKTITDAEAITARAASNVTSAAPSLLLPVQNFGRRELRRLIREAVDVRISKGALRAFRNAFFRNETFFEGRGRLAFQPTHPTTTAHGIADTSNDHIDALAAHFRAGCSFGEFHWDVYPSGQGGWGATTIECRRAGVSRPQSAHINLLIDDVVRP